MNKAITSSRQQRGAALLIALAIVALAAVIAANLIEAGNLSQRQTEVLLRQQQSLQLVSGLEDWALTVLRRDQRDTRPRGVDGKDDIWTRPLPPTPIPGGIIQGRLVELGGRFDLNSLVTPEGLPSPLARERFSRLLELLELNPGLADVAIDWIDPDSQPQPGGGENARYGNTPGKPANQPLVHISQIREWAGVDNRVFQKLLPFVQAGSGAAQGLNVNTAPVEVLMSLSPNLGRSNAESLIQQRGSGMPSVAEFLALPGWSRADSALANQPIDPRGLSVGSERFLLLTRINLNGLDWQFESLLQRRGNQYHVLLRRQTSL